MSTATRAKLLKTAELARELRVARTTIMRYVREETIPFLQVGPHGALRFQLDRVLGALHRNVKTPIKEKP